MGNFGKEIRGIFSKKLKKMGLSQEDQTKHNTLHLGTQSLMLKKYAIKYSKYFQKTEKIFEILERIIGESFIEYLENFSEEMDEMF